MNKEKRRIARRKAKPILDQTGNSVVQDAPAERSLTPNQYKGCVRGFASFCISLVIGVSSIAYGWGWYLVVWLLISGVISELVTRGKGVLSTWKMALLDEMPIPEKLVGLSGLLVVSFIDLMKLPIVLTVFYIHKWGTQICQHFGRQT